MEARSQLRHRPTLGRLPEFLFSLALSCLVNYAQSLKAALIEP
jgi:hypothetical protein